MKQRIAEFPTAQGPYLYQLQSDGSAVVFIREFIREEHRETEEGSEEVLFVYNENEFRVDSKEITEEMIAADPLSWLTYDDTIPSFETQVITALNDLGEVVGELLGGMN